MKQLSFLFLFIVTLNACQKQTTSFLIVKGRVVDAHNKQPVANYTVQIGYIDPTQGVGFNFGSWGNISSCNTDKEGYFTLTTPYALSKNTADFYRIEALSSETYFGFSHDINAAQAEEKRNITIGDVEVDKIVTLNLTINHTGSMNSNDFILGNVASARFLYYGTDSVKTDRFWLAFNKPVIINWRYRKNNMYYGPFLDTIILTNPENIYSITY
jgi:hypothetical protein